MKHRSLRHLEETAAARIREENFRDVWKAAGLSPYFHALDALLHGSVEWTNEGGVIVDLRTLQ